MEIDSFGNKLVIEGNIKSITHYNQLKSILDEMVINHKKVVVELVDSISVTSSVIGYFSKLVNVNGVVLEVYVSDDDLFVLLEDLGLIQTFSVKKIHHDN